MILAGTRLGPYEVLSPLGAGGMGEVWRARDRRLGREVALKVLPAELDASPERLKRFEREARAVASLAHPNIVTIYEVARIESTPIIVMELVEGETLRALIGGAPMPLRRVLAIAPQIAEGLARAHAAGVVHRDLKPENVMVTREGLVKILDFGLAKLTHPEQDSGGVQEQTVPMATRPGIAMGTVSYMSPEQALGHELDFRSDQFALGAVLYEMATGQCAFRRDSAPQTLTAIIEDEPEPIGKTAPRTPAPLRWVIQRCLSKEPKGRYASTEDLARELADLRDHVSELSTSAGVEIGEPRPRPRWRAIGLAATGLAALAGVFVLGDRFRLARTSDPHYRQLTYRGAGIGSARFTPDGQTVVFSSETEGRPPELFSMRIDSPEVRSLGLPPAHILSVSSTGQMAILLSRPYALMPRIGALGLELAHRDFYLLAGTLAEVSLSGGAPRELLGDVTWADWAPEGSDLAVIHRVGNRSRLEFPIGNVIYDEELVALHHVRVSSRDRQVAFQDWAALFVKKGSNPAQGLVFPTIQIAWSNTTGEIWYARGLGGIGAVTPSGRDRLVATPPADFTLYDISADGRVLLGRQTETTSIRGSFPGEPRERDLSYFSGSEACDLSASGDTLLFRDVTRNGEGAAYLRKTDGSQPKRLADLTDFFDQPVLSPDGSVVLSEVGMGSDCVHMLRPTGPGQTQRLSTKGVDFLASETDRSGFFPDGKSVFFAGTADGQRRRVWRQDLSGGPPRPLTPEDTTRPVLMGGGQFLCARGSDFRWHIYSVEGKGEPRDVVGLLPGEEPLRSTADGNWLFVRGADELKPGETLMTTRVYRLDPLTGQRELWKEIPASPARDGGAITHILFSADGKTCVWTHIRYSTELVLVEGLR